MDFKIQFKEMKERIKVVDVLYRYGVRLRKKPDSDYASCPCPLPTHPEDRNNNAFGVHLPSNRWQCKHPECARKNGVGDKWGDCINLVTTHDSVDAKQAATLLNSWFPKDKPALSHGETREVRGISPHHHIPDNTSSAVAGKYMQEIDAWFHTLIVRGDQENDVDYWARILKAVKTRLVESYRSGQRSKAA
jgi:hypothetical protein